MLSTTSVQNNSSPQVQERAIPAFDSSWSVNEIATCVFKTLGVFLVLAGVGSLIAGLQVPAIALLVSGVAIWLLGSVIPKKEEQLVPIFSNVDPQVLQTATRNAEADFFRTVAPLLGTATAVEPEVLVEPVLPVCIASVPAAPAMALGREVWLQHIGDPGEVLPLPADIEAILEGPCPFWPAKKVRETHILALIPKNVTRTFEDHSVTEPLTIRNLNKMARSADNDTGLGCRITSEVLQEIGDTPNLESHWVLMTDNKLPGDDFYHNHRLIKQAGYEIPGCLDASTAILLKIIHTQEVIFKYGDTKRNYFFCKEMIYFPFKGRDIHVMAGDYYGGYRRSDDGVDREGFEGLSIGADEYCNLKNLVAMRRL